LWLEDLDGWVADLGWVAASVLCSSIVAAGEHHQADSRHLECRVVCSSDGMPNT